MCLEIDRVRASGPNQGKLRGAFSAGGHSAWSEIYRPALNGTDYPVSEPAIFKDGLFFAPLLCGLQAFAPSIITALSLYLLTVFYAVEFGSAFKALALLSGVLAFVFLQP